MKHAPLLLLGGAAAALLAFHPMLFSGLAQIPGDLGDARLINYLLEHTWRWLLREPLHRDIWSPPVFYPATNTAAYSDLLFSAAPFYWCWRVVGLSPDAAFACWLLTVSSLNYLAMYVFLARLLRLRSLASALGALLFTAANCHVAESFHPQLYVHFYTVVAVHALIRFFQTTAGAASSRLSPGAWYGVFCLACVLQIYASFYLGWFLALALLIAAVLACRRAQTRQILFGALRQRRRALIGWTAAAAVLTAPLAWHYLLAARNVGMRDWGSVAGGLPAPQSWFLIAPGNWVYHWIPWALSRDGPTGLGVGILTTFLAAWGLWQGRKEPVVFYVLLVAVGMILLVTRIGPITLWFVVYLGVPGGAAVRAAYRICLMVLFAAAVGAACCINERKRLWAAAGLALLCLLEQGRTPPTYSKEESRRRVQQTAARVPPGCTAFLYTPRGDPDNQVEAAAAQLDAMGAELATGVPTINGCSGNFPPQYPFANPLIRQDQDLDEVDARRKDWCERHGLEPDSVAWIHD
jgi:hypothetical protein